MIFGFSIKIVEWRVISPPQSQDQWIIDECACVEEMSSRHFVMSANCFHYIRRQQVNRPSILFVRANAKIPFPKMSLPDIPFQHKNHKQTNKMTVQKDEEPDMWIKDEEPDMWIE